ncbi:MAG TPA: winged helix DNA-binding domain-containing protein [Patescibacteria group bacterium]|nr:winged helix DNA-binding domain-containing protein [Patescibacteria group bacterium]
MTIDDLIRARLTNQQLTNRSIKNVADLVSWFGAVQAQDYAGAKWGLGQRLGINDKEIEEAFNSGEILRTHIMRPTWHFVYRNDIKWMQKLTSPRVNQIMSYYNRLLSLDKTFFDKTNRIISSSLKGGKFLTRLEIAKILEENNISIRSQKLAHVVSQAELDGIICSGPRTGKQFTYALLAERAPEAKDLNKKESLKELAERFFQSHGPATAKDFVWWSGLTMVDAKEAIGLAKLENEDIGGKKYWYVKPLEKVTRSNLFLLPNYDEYTIAYKDRDAFLAPEVVRYFKAQGNASFWNAIIFDGKIIGMWKRTIQKDSVIISIKLFNGVGSEVKKDLEKACSGYGRFWNLKPVINIH